MTDKPISGQLLWWTTSRKITR